MEESFFPCDSRSLLSRGKRAHSVVCALVFAGIFMSTCNVDVRWFPFDIQTCELKFGSWTYDGWLLDLQMSDADTSSYMPNGEWDLIGGYGEASLCSDPYQRATQTISRPPCSCRSPRHQERDLL